MRAFVTGIAGQDGSYLTEHLLNDGIEVFGMVRRHSYVESQQHRINHLRHKVKVFYGDMNDKSSLERILREVKPDYIFNLAAQSQVRISSDLPDFTVQTNGFAVVSFLDAVRWICPEARFYQASSSEMFGTARDLDNYQRETTNMWPTSPYGCAKLFAFSMVRHFRNAYDMFASNGILFNHESPRRGENFVSQKVCMGAVMVKRGLIKSIELGNLDSYRDWGHSKDYTRAMIKILQHDSPDDFVISTGVTHSVRDMCKFVFGYLGLDYADYVTQNTELLRPQELPYLRGDSSKARNTLKWDNAYTFENMLVEMVEFWMNKPNEAFNTFQ